jgi:hypothetical protein
MAEHILDDHRLAVPTAFDDLLELHAALSSTCIKEAVDLSEEVMHRACTELATREPTPSNAKTFARAALFCSRSRLEAEAAGGEIEPLLVLRALEAAAA